MDLKDFLTNEKLSKKFKSQFELVNYAIKLAENMIRTGRDPRVKIDVQNRAMQILAEIANNKDQFDEIPVQESRENPPHENRLNGRESQQEMPHKSSERKKGRKILSE